MPTTPNVQLPYPALSDTPDVPRDIEALAVKVDDVITTALVQPVSVVRTSQDSIPGGTWGQMMSWTGTLPAGALLLLATYKWASGDKCNFRFRVDGAAVPAGYESAGPGGGIETNTVHTVHQHQGGTLTVTADFGFDTGVVTIYPDSRLTIVAFPTTTIRTTGGSQQVSL